MPVAELDVEVPVAEVQRSPHQLPERLALEARYETESASCGMPGAASRHSGLAARGGTSTALPSQSRCGRGTGVREASSPGGRQIWSSEVVTAGKRGASVASYEFEFAE